MTCRRHAYKVQKGIILRGYHLKLYLSPVFIYFSKGGKPSLQVLFPVAFLNLVYQLFLIDIHDCFLNLLESRRPKRVFLNFFSCV